GAGRRRGPGGGIERQWNRRRKVDWTPDQPLARPHLIEERLQVPGTGGAVMPDRCEVEAAPLIEQGETVLDGCHTRPPASPVPRGAAPGTGRSTARVRYHLALDMVEPHRAKANAPMLLGRGEPSASRVRRQVAQCRVVDLDHRQSHR